MPNPGHTGISRPARILFHPAILVQHGTMPPVTQPHPPFCQPGDLGLLCFDVGGQWERG